MADFLVIKNDLPKKGYESVVSENVLDAHISVRDETWELMLRYNSENVSELKSVAVQK